MKRLTKIAFVLYFILTPFISYSQLIFHQETFRGGTTGAGFSTALGSGSGTFNIYIEPGSTIKKAWLFAQRQGYPQPANIIINSINYVFDTSLVITSVPQSGIAMQCSPLAIDVIDVTNNINPSTTNYNITIPVTNQNTPYACWGYSAFYLIVLYENNTLPLHHSVILLNNKQIITNTTYSVTDINPINTNYPVGFAMFSDRISNLIGERVFSFFNGALLGLVGGSDAVNSLWSGAGIKGHFYYQNNTLFGLDDDTPDSLMNGSDGLADVSNYLANNTTSFNYLIQYETPNDHTNLYDAWFLTYTTPCDTFTTTATPNDTICLGENVQLQAIGGVQYSWFSAFGGLSDTSIANPMASPPQTTTYIVTIKNDSGCVKTEQVKIWVNPLPVADTIIVTNNFCGDSVGSLQVVNVLGTPPFNYQITNLQSSNTTNQNTNLFDSLGTGAYEMLITDNNGCQWADTAIITETNNVVANFTATPSSGIAPLLVDFDNNSQNANNFEWTVSEIASFLAMTGPKDTLLQDSTLNTQYLFSNSGTYQVCLVAYNNIPTCADTSCKTIIVTDNISFVIPNVFTPNFDGENDNFVIQLTGARLIKELKVEIFNRWGMLLKSSTFDVQDLSAVASSPSGLGAFSIWDGRTTAAEIAPDGTYFYVVTYTALNGEEKSEKGSVTLLR